MDDWEKTVMNFDAISDASLVVFADEGDEEYCTHKRVAQAQAKITWQARDSEIEEARKAGYERGFDEGLSKAMDAAEETYGAQIDNAKQAGIKEGIRRANARN